MPANQNEPESERTETESRDRTLEDRINEEMVAERSSVGCPACGVPGTASDDPGTRFCFNEACATIEFIADDDRRPEARIAGTVSVAAQSAWHDPDHSDYPDDPGTQLLISGFGRRPSARAWAKTAERNQLIRGDWGFVEDD